MLLINHVLLISKDILKKETDIEYQNIVDEIIGIYSSQQDQTDSNYLYLKNFFFLIIQENDNVNNLYNLIRKRGMENYEFVK